MEYTDMSPEQIENLFRLTKSNNHFYIMIKI